MDNQWLRLCSKSVFFTAAITVLAACGGATSQVPNVGMGQEAIPVDETTADASSLEAAGNETTVTTGTEITDAEKPDANADTTESTGPETQSNSDAFSPDQELLDAAGDVGCDAEAGLFNATMLELINASRSEVRMCGELLREAVSTVTWNDNLAAAAAMHGNDMATNNFFDHTGSDGLGVGERATTALYNWRAVGENIAAGQQDQAEVHQGWLDSEGHCKNIMNNLFTEVGAACITDPGSDFGTYWVVVFGDHK